MDPIHNNNGSVCWSYKDEDEWKAYDDATSAQIEQAYLNNKKEVKLTTGPFFGLPQKADVYVIKFDSNNQLKTFVQQNTKTAFIRQVNRNQNGQNINTEISILKTDPIYLIPSNKDGTVCWVYSDSEWHWTAYDKESNQQIEDAWLNNEKNVLLNKGPFFGTAQRKNLYSVCFKRNELPITCMQVNTQTNYVRQIIRSRKKIDDEKQNDAELVKLQQQNVKHAQENNMLTQQNAELKQKYLKLENKQKELSNNMAILQHEKKEMEIERITLREELKRVKLENLNERDYENWGGEELLSWIINLDHENYKQYEKILTKHFKNECVDGSCLADIEKNDIKSWGISNFKHRNAIYKKMKELLNKYSRNSKNSKNTNSTQYRENDVAPAATYQPQAKEGSPTAYI